MPWRGCRRDAAWFRSRREASTQKQLPDLGVVQYRARLARHARAPGLDHDAEIRDLERALGVLLDHQDRHALRAQLAQDVEGLAHEERRQADRRLVYQYELRLEQQAARDLQQLLLAARERRGLGGSALA